MDIIKKVTKDAERLLKSLRAKYYIELPTGEQIWHDLDGYELVPSEVEEEKPRRKRQVASGRSYGELTAYFKPTLDACQNVGDVAEIKPGKYLLEDVAAGVSAYCSVHWGKGTYRTSTNKIKGQVEVLRTAPSQPKAKPQSKVNGAQQPANAPKFRSLGHGMDALQNLKFDDEQHQP